MPQQVLTTVENNFTGGLKTEYTGLNFPENAATDTDNCVYSIIGEVRRRAGIDLEDNYDWHDNPVSDDSKAFSYYVWNNAGGDGSNKILVIQIGSELYFYRISAATETLPLSWQRLPSVLTISGYIPSGSTFDPAPHE